MLKLFGSRSESNDVHLELVDTGDSQAEKIPSYEAVSWCWGKEKADQAIYVHSGGVDYQFQVPPNLLSALKALRNKDSVRWLWIDAIAINQKDLNERNAQVPLMDQIYGNAERVCIWLGESDEKSRKGFQVVDEMTKKVMSIDDLIKNKLIADDWACFMSVLRKDWFSRRYTTRYNKSAGI
jgi:hypothetical protein